MSGQASDISIRFRADGEDHVVRSINKVRMESDRTRTPMVDDLPKLRDVAATIGKITLAVGAIGAGGVLAFNAALGKSKELAIDVAEQLKALDEGAVRLGSDSATGLGGFAFAGKSAGLNGLQDVVALGGSMLDIAQKVRDYNEETVDALNGIEFRYQDIFSFDPDKEMYNGRTLGADDILLNTIKRLESTGATVEEIMDNFTPMIGRDGSAKIAALFELGSAQIEGLAAYYDDLTDIRADDFDAAKDFQASMVIREAAVLGVSNAFSRHMWPVLAESNIRFADFLTKNRERIGELGGAFADFNTRASSLFSALGEQALIAASGEYERVDGASLRAALEAGEKTGEVGNRDLEYAQKIIAEFGEIKDEVYFLFSDQGGGGIQMATPMMLYAERLVELVTDFRDGMIDVMDYMSTGKTDAPWLQSIISFFERLQELTEKFSKEMIGFGEILDERIIPAINSFVDSISGMLKYFFGIDNSIATGAVIAGMLLFTRTLIGLAQLLVVSFGVIAQTAIGITGLTLAGGAGGAAAGLTLGGAAAIGGTAVGGAAGMAWMQSSTTDLEGDMDHARRRAEELAAEHGEAYAAAYMQAVIDHRPGENIGFQLANWIGSKIGLGVDFDGANEGLSKIMTGADEADLVGGYAEAMRDFGWEPDAGGKVQIGAELEVESFELAAAAQRQIDDILRVELLGTGMADALTPDLSGFSDYMDKAMQGLGLGPASGQAPVIIQLPSGEQISGFSGSTNAIDQLSRASSLATRSRS